MEGRGDLNKRNNDRQAWARERMVDKDIVPRGVKDHRVLEAMRKVPRHIFVSATQRMSAYEDHPLPIGEGQTISQPFMVAMMTEALLLEGKESVLEIGTGTGYNAGLMQYLVGDSRPVVSIDIDEDLVESAREHLRSAGLDNVKVVCGDGGLGEPRVADLGQHKFGQYLLYQATHAVTSGIGFHNI